MAESDLPFTTWLKRRRRSLDLTQAELAQQVAYSIFTIRKVETGELRPSKALAARLAEALEIPLNDRPAFVDFARGKPGCDQRLSPIPAPELPAYVSEPRARHNLPSPLTSFVGREAEVDAACALLARSDVRLLTLTGPGGVGKTRLALRVAALSLTAFPDGVCFCALGSLTDPGPVASAIANELGLVSSPHQSIVDSLKYYLRHKDQLLLLDCFEIVLDAAPLLSELLAAAPQLKLLVTSRILLRLSAEHNFSVAPFALPGRDDLAPDQLDASPAVRLFVERAAALRPGFMLDGTNGPIISQICRRLDGLPLAIELAAARLRVLSPQALLVRLEPRLPLLSEGPRDLPERQRTLHNTIAWSYKLLGEAEQRVFNWLAVFAGGGSVEATEYLGGAVSSHPADMVSILGRLADNSLVRLVAGPEDEPRFTILDTLREYGLEQLAASGEEPAIRGGTRSTMRGWPKRATRG